MSALTTAGWGVRVSLKMTDTIHQTMGQIWVLFSFLLRRQSLQTKTFKSIKKNFLKTRPSISQPNQGVLTLI